MTNLNLHTTGQLRAIANVLNLTGVRTRADLIGAIDTALRAGKLPGGRTYTPADIAAIVGTTPYKVRQYLRAQGYQTTSGARYNLNARMAGRVVRALI